MDSAVYDYEQLVHHYHVCGEGLIETLFSNLTFPANRVCLEGVEEFNWWYARIFQDWFVQELNHIRLLYNDTFFLKRTIQLRRRLCVVTASIKKVGK
jgi:hypothetical protein